jgi:hypothetical protein
VADISIDASVGATYRGIRSVAFHRTNDLIGYWFYMDGDGKFCYRKTTDGGATWGAPVEIDSATTVVAYDIWAAWWTPGDTGTLIHLWWFDTTASDVYWRTLDTSGDTLGTRQTVAALTSATATRGAFVSGAKSRSGYLYAAFDIDAGVEKGLYRSTDSGANWSLLDAGFVEATIDQCLLFPASNTADDNDIWALYHDADVNELTLKMWDSSAASAVESASMATVAEHTSDGGQYAFSGSVRHSDGHLIVASCGAYDNPTSDFLVFDINGTGSITALTAIVVNIDDLYFPQVFIDQVTNDIYVLHNGLTTGAEVAGTASKVYYAKSTDDGATWASTDSAYMQDAAAAVFQVWAPLMGSRFYAGWLIGSALLGNFANSISLAPPAVTARPVVFICG